MTAEELLRDVVDHVDDVCTEKHIGHFEYNRFLDKLKDRIGQEEWQQEHIGPLYVED